MLKKIIIKDFSSSSGSFYKELPLSYELFGRKLHSAPIVLINHALTGNSNVSGKNGWWNDLVGDNKVIDTKKYTVLAYNIPGNGYDGYVIEKYKDFITRDIANIFLIGDGSGGGSTSSRIFLISARVSAGELVSVSS